MTSELTIVPITNLPIRLSQLLKFVDIVLDGSEARIMIQNGQVMVNGEKETRRGRKIYVHDIITVDGRSWVISAKS